MRPASPPKPPPLPDAARLSAILAEIAVWLCAVRVWLAEMGAALGFDMRAERLEIRADLRKASQQIESVLFLLAVPQLRAREPVLMGAPRAYRRAPPRGFRRRRDHTSALRAVRRALVSPHAKGDLRQRLARLDDLIARRNAWIARIVARVCKGPHGGGVAMVAAPECCSVGGAPACMPDGADTS